MENQRTPHFNDQLRERTMSMAATRARSDAEFYAKICIVAEECDETQFWIDYLIRVSYLTATDCVDLQKEIEEEVRIFTTIKQKMKEKISKRD